MNLNDKMIVNERLCWKSKKIRVYCSLKQHTEKSFNFNAFQSRGRSKTK